MPKNKVKLEDPTIALEITIPHADIKKAYDVTINQVAAKTELKGFRKGKAPIEVVEQNVDKSKVYEMVFDQVFPPAYQNLIKTHHLHPVASPRIEIKDAKTNGDWQLNVKIAVKPEIILGSYQDQIKTALGKSQIWVPGKADKTPEKSDKNDDKVLNQIFDILLKNTTVSISSILVEDEANRTLSRLLDQIGKLGLTLEQYVKSLNKTIDALKQEHQQTAEATLKLEYILVAIAQDQKLEASEKEYLEFLAAVKNPATIKQINNDESVQTAIRYNLTKQKVVKYLLNLAN